MYYFKIANALKLFNSFLPKFQVFKLSGKAVFTHLISRLQILIERLTQSAVYFKFRLFLLLKLNHQQQKLLKIIL